MTLSMNLINCRDKWNLIIYICMGVISAHCIVSTHRLVLVNCSHSMYIKCCRFIAAHTHKTTFKFHVSYCVLHVSADFILVLSQTERTRLYRR